MRIIDTYLDMLELIDKMNGSFDLSLWEQYLNKTSDKLPDKILSDSNSYDYENEILPVLELFFNSKEKIELLHENFVLVTKNLRDRCIDVFGFDLDVDIIFYLGLCNGAGWATTFENRKVILLGAEKIIELDWCTQKHLYGLIYHELGHVWHETVRQSCSDVNIAEKAQLRQLYNEGIAMYCEQLLCDDMCFYHQDTNCWYDWCNKNKTMLFKEFLRRIDNDENVQDFFGDWNNYLGYSDIGYYLGTEFIQELAKENSLQDLAVFNIDLIYVKFKAFI